MSASDAERRINRLLDKAEKNQVFPQVSADLHKAIQEGNATTYKLEKLLFTDTKLGLAIVTRASQLQKQNWSTMRDLPAAIESVGLARLNSMVMAIEVAKLTISGRESLRKYWAHALRTACLARAIAAQTMTVPEEDAFVGGIVHDIGVIFMRAVGSSSYPKTLRLCGVTLVGLSLLERDRYGYDHGEIGQMMMGRMGGSKILLDGVYTHHEEKPSALGAVLHVADNIDVFSTLGMSQEMVANSAVDLAVAQQIGLKESNYLELIKQAHADANAIMLLVSQL
jgi:HD-like signal output (HDOD) protein